MKRSILNVTLALSLLITLLLNWGIRPSHRRPNREFLPNMVRSIPFDAYAENPYFPDGKTLQPPPAGTISRGAVRLDYPPDSSGANLAGLELANPYTLDSAAARADGGYVYRDFCLPCHGAEGMGDGPVALRGYPPPPSLTGPPAMEMSDGRLLHIITYGQGNMPGYAAQIPLSDRWKAVIHIRALQMQAEASTVIAGGSEAIPAATGGKH